MKIEATIKTVAFYDEESSFAILQLLSDGKQITAKGVCPDLKLIDNTEKAKGLSCIVEGDWVKHSKFGDPQKLSLIEIVGDSMEPTFKSGDIILVNHNQNYLDKAGGIYAIAVKSEDSIMVKRLQYDYQSGKILVMSDNKLYQTFLVSEDEIVINGRVVWYGREI